MNLTKSKYRFIQEYEDYFHIFQCLQCKNKFNITIDQAPYKFCPYCGDYVEEFTLKHPRYVVPAPKQHFPVFQLQYLHYDNGQRLSKEGFFATTTSDLNPPEWRAYTSWCYKDFSDLKRRRMSLKWKVAQGFQFRLLIQRWDGTHKITPLPLTGD